MKKIVVGLAVVLGFCTCAHQPSGTLDVNKALDYCAKQTQRTLTELKTDSGIDYTMMPRNIMADEQHWNCRSGVLVFGQEYFGMITNIQKISKCWKKRRISLTH